MTDKTIKYMALVTMAAGLFGMLFCFPFLWSARMEDLVGAGFPFVGGAVLFGAGLLALAVVNKKQ
ncbi:MAG: hypothetical protein NTW29_08995 [Bacteroidetes bacterium]|nr:hypothetical protein [Bacteroidota bacterium]